MFYCPKCETNIPLESKFCLTCGINLKEHAKKTDWDIIKDNIYKICSSPEPSKKEIEKAQKNWSIKIFSPKR